MYVIIKCDIMNELTERQTRLIENINLWLNTHYVSIQYKSEWFDSEDIYSILNHIEYAKAYSDDERELLNLVRKEFLNRKAK